MEDKRGGSPVILFQVDASKLPSRSVAIDPSRIPSINVLNTVGGVDERTRVQDTGRDMRPAVRKKKGEKMFSAQDVLRMMLQVQLPPTTTSNLPHGYGRQQPNRLRYVAYFAMQSRGIDLDVCIL